MEKYIRVTYFLSEFAGVIGKVLGESKDLVLVTFGDPGPRYRFFKREHVVELPENELGIIEIIPTQSIANLTTELLNQVRSRLSRINLVLQHDREGDLLLVTRKSAILNQ